MANHPDDIRTVRILERGPAGDGVTSGEAASIESRLTALEAATPPSDIDDLDDVDTSTSAPSAGDLLRWDDGDGEWQPYTPQAQPETGALIIVFGDGVNAMPTGVQPPNPRVPFDCTITRAVLTATGTVTSFVLDIWKDTFANYPPTDADSITASAPPTLTSTNRSSDATLTGWTTSINADDILRFNIDSASTSEAVTLTLYLERDIGPAV